MSILDPRTWFRRTETSLALRAEVMPAPPSTRVATATRRHTGTQDPARDRNLERAAAALARCFTGYTSDFIDCCKSTRRYDARLDAVARKRILAIVGRRWALKPPPGFETDREAIDNCRLVTSHFNETRGFASKLGHLGHAVLEGHAGLQHQWYRNSRGENATQPREVHPRLFGWDTATAQAGVYMDGAASMGARSGLTFLDSARDEFVFHNPTSGGADDPWLRGALRARVLPSVAKRMGAAWWLKSLERWGQPQVVLEKGSDEASENGEGADAEYVRMLRQIGTDWRAVVPPGTKITSIPVTLHHELHEKWVAKCDSDDAIAILGQNLSTEVVGGSFAAARAHSWVLATILEADLAELAETITDQWIEPIVRFNRPGSPVPWLYINPAPLSELTPADMGVVDEAGRRVFSAAEYRASKGYDMRPEDEQPETAAAPVEMTPAAAAPKVDEITKALELARGAGLQATQSSVAALVAGLGLATEKIPDGAPQPKPIPLAPTDLAKVVLVPEARGSVGLAPFGDARDLLTITELDAQIAAAAEKAKIEAAAAAAAPAQADLVAQAAEPPPAATTPIEVGAIWTDTTDGHRLKVNAVEDGKVYLVDLDAENPAAQFAWNKAAFRERCTPPPAPE